ARGVAYFSAAGNGGSESYSSAFRPSSVDYPGGSGKWHNFATSGPERIYQVVEIPVGAKTTLSLQWDEPFYSVSGIGARNDLDIHLVDAAGTLVAGGISSNVGGDPIEVISFENDGRDRDGDGKPDTQFFLYIGLRAGSPPGRFKYVTDNGLT